jgi:signal peptidase II
MSKVSRERGAVITAVLIFAVDQTLKFFLYSRNFIREKVVLIKGILYLVPASKNPGIAFGLFKNYSYFFVITASLAIFFILLVYLRTNKEKTILRWSLLLILAGAVSNLQDRLIYGSVIDYLLLGKFPYSFNLADSSILAGVGLVIIKIIKDFFIQDLRLKI